MLAKTFGSAVYGVNATMITIEVTVGQGLGFFMVGLADSAVKALSIVLVFRIVRNAS